MIFWDTSALVPLVVNEPMSGRARELRRADRRMAVWWGTWVECESALTRRLRGGELAPATVERARRALEVLRGQTYEIVASDQVRQAAIDVVMRRGLHAADALQLAAALDMHGRRSVRFACFDAKLRAAAEAEGLQVT